MDLYPAMVKLSVTTFMFTPPPPHHPTQDPGISGYYSPCNLDAHLFQSMHFPEPPVKHHCLVPPDPILPGNQIVVGISNHQCPR